MTNCVWNSTVSDGGDCVWIENLSDFNPATKCVWASTVSANDECIWIEGLVEDGVHTHDMFHGRRIKEDDDVIMAIIIAFLETVE